ncbi:protein of unknown function [Paraburkholderia kururiensis]
MMQAHGDDAMAASAESRCISDIENNQRTRITRPMARSAKSVPAPGAAFARVCFVLVKAILLSCAAPHFCGTAIIGTLGWRLIPRVPKNTFRDAFRTRGAAQMQQRPVAGGKRGVVRGGLMTASSHPERACAR